MSTNDKFKYAFWMLLNITFVVMCGLITCLMPVVNALEDETTAALSLTASGRFQIAWHSFVGVLVVSLFPAGLSYLFSKWVGIKDEQPVPVRVNKDLKMALFVWAALVVSGLIGAIGFWLQVHPLQPA